jgi:2,4-dienoyl-CoA reductase-like NADH-dependent reductase (Old Yellow Enzyme family)
MSYLFSPYELSSPRGPLKLANRVVVAPMCQYSAVQGSASDWHLMHWANLLNSGSAMMIIEATGVSPEGRISPQCLGLWDDTTASALQDKLQRARRLAPYTPVAIQLSHAGRKASRAAPWNGGALLSLEQGGWNTHAPSAIPHQPHERAPLALESEGLKEVCDAFVNAAKLAHAIGIEAVELHAAHGYLLHQFLSPVSNQRSDEYGGSFENRIRFPLKVFNAVRAHYSGTLGMRISACDWVDAGWTPEETTQLSIRLKALGADFVHISSGGVSSAQKVVVAPNYQVPFASQVKAQSSLSTIAVGLITQAQQANDIIASGQADLVALARALLYKPRWTWEAATVLNGQVQASKPYWRCLPKEAQEIFTSMLNTQR